MAQPVAEIVLVLFDKMMVTEDRSSLVAEILRLTNGRDPSAVIRDHFREENLAPEPDHGFYDLADFMALLQRIRGRTYGWRVDLVVASKTTPDVRECKNEEIQKWQKNKKVPAWAFDQVGKLVWPKRKGENGPQWSTNEYAFLRKKYLESEGHISNKELAALCEKEFGRPISENAIKGALDRERRRDKLSKYRPGRKAADDIEEAA